MINDRIPLSMAEATAYMDKSSEGEMLAFVKKFTKLKAKEAKELRVKIQKLNILKLDEKSISKIIDLMPSNEEELSKVFVGLSLDEEETKKVLDVVKEFK